jgi:hypothetical protein
MNTVLPKIISIGLLFLLIFLSGFWLSRMDRPYPIIIFTLHKLIALGSVIFLGMMVYKIHQTAPLHSTQVAVVGVTILCLVAAIITGGLLSVEKDIPRIVLQLHQVIPYLTVLSVGVTLYLVLIQNSLLLPG